MTDAFPALADWLVAASVLLLWLAPIVALIDRMTTRWWSPQVRAWLWHLLLLRVLLPTTAVPEPLALPVPRPGNAGAVPTDGGPWLFGWLLGAAALAVAGTLAARHQHRRVLAGTTPADSSWQAALRVVAARMRLRRLPGLRLSAVGGGPCVVGIRRPVIVLPTHLHGLPGAARAHLLAHELAHVVRHDALRRAVLLPALVVFWFHPGMWLLVLRLRALSEVAADATAVQSTNRGFAVTLRACVQARLRPQPQLRGLALVGTVAELRERFAALRQPARGGRRHVLALLCAWFLVVCCAPVAARLPTLTGLGELPGCLPKRFLVLAALAREQAPAPR